MRDMPHSYEWHDSFICMTWLIHLRDMTPSSVWHDSFICVTWLIYMCDMTHLYVWRDSFICVTPTHPHACNTSVPRSWICFTNSRWVLQMRVRDTFMMLQRVRDTFVIEFVIRSTYSKWVLQMSWNITTVSWSLRDPHDYICMRDMTHSQVMNLLSRTPDELEYYERITNSTRPIWLYMYAWHDSLTRLESLLLRKDFLKKNFTEEPLNIGVTFAENDL